MPHKEPDIEVNGIKLNSAQAMAVRVAIAGFLYELSDPEEMMLLGEIGPLYQARLSEVQSLMVEEWPNMPNSISK